jgi:DNA-binding XRE family transcriptional regulator
LLVNNNVTYRLCTHRLPARKIRAMPLDIRVRFGRAIRRIREDQKINQEEAADRCGLHRTYYSGIERGVRNVSLVNIEKIGKGLKTSLTELFRKV